MGVIMKNRIKIQLLVLSILGFSLVGCASNKAAPLWANSDTLDMAFPPDEYIAKIGYGTQMDIAQSLAAGELAGFFQKTIKSHKVASQKLTSNSTGTTTDDRVLEKTVDVTSNVNLVGSTYTTPFYDKVNKRYVCCGYINRREAWEIYEPVLSKSKSEFDKSFALAKNEVDPLTKIKLLAEAEEFAANYESKLDFVTVLYNKGAAKYEDSLEKSASINLEKQKAKLNCIFKVEVTNDLNSMIKSSITKILQEAGYKTSDSKYAYLVKANQNYQQVKVMLFNNEMLTGYSNIDIQITNGKKIFCQFSKDIAAVTLPSAIEFKVKEQVYSSTCIEIQNSLIEEFEKGL